MLQLQLAVNTLYTTIYFTAFNLWKGREKDVLELLCYIENAFYRKNPKTNNPLLKFISNGSRILCYFHLVLIRRWNLPIQREFMASNSYFNINGIHILLSFGWHNEYNIQESEKNSVLYYVQKIEMH